MSFLNLYVLEKFVYFFKCDNVKINKLYMNTYIMVFIIAGCQKT